MNSPQDLPTPTIWLQDFQSILAHTPITRDGVEELIYSRHPDAGWADEYVFSLWHAYCYLVENEAEWEKSGLAVVGGERVLVKDSLLLALFTPFLGIPLEEIEKLDFPPEAIAEQAKNIQKLYPGKT